MKRNAIEAHDLRRIAVATELDPRAVRRAIIGASVRRSTRALVMRAAADLGINLAPPETAAA